jgi:hypothetical protein
VKRAEAQRLFEEIKANSAKLQGCAGHRFTLPATAVESTILGRVKVSCSVCGGTTDLHDAQLYMQGVLAHRKDPSLAIDALKFEVALDEAWKKRKAARGGGR